MTEPNDRKMNQLLRQLPEGLLVDSAWMSEHGYSTGLRSQYVSAGWLEQPARRVYRRARGPLRWEHVVISLQWILRRPFVVGGRTALELQGFAHYLSPVVGEVHLEGPNPLPTWIASLPLKVRFHDHNSERLFPGEDLADVFAGLPRDPQGPSDWTPPPELGLKPLPWTHFNWPIIASAPERAILEVIAQLPKHESFHVADKLMEGLTALSPRRLAGLLRSCRSVKVKRLFFFLAFRHNHAWLAQLDPEAFDLGAGKRVLVSGGRLDRRFQITVPEDLDGEP